MVWGVLQGSAGVSLALGRRLGDGLLGLENRGRMESKARTPGRDELV